MQKYFEKIVERLEAAKGIAFLTLANTGDKTKDVVYDEVIVYMNTAIEIVNQVAEEYATIPTPYHPIPIDTQMYIAELEKKVNGDGWIPCSEDMPKDGGSFYWVTIKMKYHFETDYEYNVDIASYYDCHWETWNDWYEGQDYYEIIAWKPCYCPTPYQPKGEE